MERYTKILTMFLVALFLFAQTSCNGKKETEPKPKASPIKSLSKEELAERIKHMLEITPEISNLIPELKITYDKTGGIVDVKYNASGILKALKELGKEELVSFYNRVNNERVRAQTERIERQLEAVRSSVNAERPPQVYMPPSQPTLPSAPPKIPTPPPAPEPTRR